MKSDLYNWVWLDKSNKTNKSGDRKLFYMNVLRNFTAKCFLFIGRLRGRFLTVHTRPMFSKDISYKGKEIPEDASCGVIIQGPVWRENNFTLETIKFYRQFYPAATVVLSTWEDENVEEFEVLADRRFKIIKNSKPAFPGKGNMHLQVVTTKAGLDAVVQAGCRYALKTRTDQRLYGIDCLKFLENIIAYFPVKPGSGQKSRLVGINIGVTKKYFPYHMSDVFMFGTVSDMQIYWNPNLNLLNGIYPKDFMVERYLFTEFLKKTGWQVKNTMEDSTRAFGERCVILDNESLDVYWPKHQQHREYRLKNYFFPKYEISFKEWFNEAFMPTLNTKD